mgnify:CR=1 FL=1
MELLVNRYKESVQNKAFLHDSIYLLVSTSKQTTGQQPYQ